MKFAEFYYHSTQAKSDTWLYSDFTMATNDTFLRLLALFMFIFPTGD